MNSQTSVPSSNSKSSINQLNNVQASVEVSSEQNTYANILLVCSWTGIAVMLVTFLLYMGGFNNPTVSPSDMPLYWGMSVHEYALATHAPSGWAWLSMISHADYLNLIGLAFLGIVSVLGYLSLFVAYMRKKDLPYITMVSLEIIVIVLAASGIFNISAG
ncbi:hypothetical protein [Desulfosporosinus sp. OT]|uniref:hypothetical protein n=1 Tax=Desulfosporosinus sp. OT TaxID=913865 RepID=UPI0002239CCA|nr:hypothetical protein [Desulfosporosinus sp. OT]EGW39549.1 hypothetical protein DOT_2602 [Desulfosporosinus sp. OT]